MQIARKLVEQDQQREPTRRSGRPAVQPSVGGCSHGIAEALADLVRFVQQAGECAFTDSAVEHAAAYKSAHAAICLSIPFGTLRHYLPEPERLVGIRFANNGALSRLASMLLLSIWSSAEDGTAASDGLRAAHALLGVVARCAPESRNHDGDFTRVSCAQVKQLINAEIRNPALCVQFVAAYCSCTRL